MTVTEMLDRISSLELTYWRALFRIRSDEFKQANQ
jgi:hypothetical protein